MGQMPEPSLPATERPQTGKGGAERERGGREGAHRERLRRHTQPCGVHGSQTQLRDKENDHAAMCLSTKE